MNAPANRPRRVFIRYPKRYEIEGRTFILNAVDTRYVLELAREYESFIHAHLGDNDEFQHMSDGSAFVELMVELVELCEEEGVGDLRGRFEECFAPNDFSPFLLMLEIAETLFGPFFEGGMLKAAYPPLVRNIVSR